jgi:hypothetical protein
MDKGSRFSLIVVTSTAMMLGGCGASRNAQGQCVDASGRVMPDSYCRSGATGSRYLYGGSVSNGRVLGGSASPPASSVSRGGFGSSGSFGG